MKLSKYSVHLNHAVLLIITSVLSACGGERTMDITKDPTNGATLFDWPFILFPILIILVAGLIAWDKIKDLFK